MADRVSCGEALVRLLERYGVDTVFGIPGVHTLDLYRGLARSSVRHVLVRHEQGAGFMADGYARASGRPGVCFVITGPGVTNVATAMGQAFSDSVPMLVISSVNETYTLGKGWGQLHEVTDQRAVTAPLAAVSATASTPDDIPDLLARAFTVFASARPRPVHIEIPLDVLAAQADGGWAPREPAAHPVPAPAAAEAAATLLAEAERPMIVAGGGALDAGAEITGLEEAAGAIVVTTTAGKGVVPDSHPLSLGGTLSLAPTLAGLGAADVVLALGTELSDTDSWVERLELTGKLIRVDIDSHKISDRYAATLAIQADAKATAGAVLAALEKRRRNVALGAVEARAAAIRGRLAPRWWQSIARSWPPCAARCRPTVSSPPMRPSSPIPATTPSPWNAPAAGITRSATAPSASACPPPSAPSSRPPSVPWSRSRATRGSCSRSRSFRPRSIWGWRSRWCCGTTTGSARSATTWANAASHRSPYGHTTLISRPWPPPSAAGRRSPGTRPASKPRSGTRSALLCPP